MFDAEIAPAAMVFVPSELCGIVVVPEAISTVPPAAHEYCEEEEYARFRTTVPSIVTFAPILMVEK